MSEVFHYRIFVAFRYCPPSLQSHLIRVVIEEMQTICRQQPEICGFKPQDNSKE